MPAVLYCDPDVLGRDPRVWCEAELGAASPLAFEDGHALVEDDEAADLLVRRRGPIEYAGAGNDGDPDYFETAESGASGGSSDDATDESDGDEDADEPPTCAGEKGDGSPCTRDVDEPGDYCWQHEE